ncbi:hypothetical protein HZS_6703 [Henneguya salminicola]|nr:hypothetical protein HZS_6703 [Henneguya salminicola]
MKNYSECVLIIDAGSQYCKLIDRIVRKLCVETVLSPLGIDHTEIFKKKYSAIIISGGPGSASFETDQTVIDEQIFELGIPILGICLGMQLMVRKYGGKVEKLNRREDAQTKITIDETCDLYIRGLEKDQTVLLTHGDSCTVIPAGFKTNAFSSLNVAVSVSNDEKKLYGVQFHPEVNLTVNGEKITLVSGGVDSTVCAALIERALPSHKKLYFLVDNGFLREKETATVRNYLLEVGIDVTVIDAKHQFYNATTFLPSHCVQENMCEETGPLRFMFNPECKRHIIGDTFMSSRVNIVAIIIGTLRPDLIESASPTVSHSADVIKTHHNDTGFVRKLRLQGKILEPLQNFHKDEVRKLGATLLLPQHILNRFPFPGPGIAIRIICGDTPTFIGESSNYDIPSLAEFIANFHQHSKEALNPITRMIQQSLSKYSFDNLMNATNQNYYLTATLVPVLSVGIQGDSRSYGNIISLSTDCKSVDWKGLSVIGQIIPKICLSINRVVYAFGDKIQHPINSITFTFLSPEVIQLVRKADHIVETILQDCGILIFVNLDEKSKICQFPVVLIPVHFDLPPHSLYPSAKRALVLRPFVSQDFMTGISAIPNEHIKENTVLRIKDELCNIPTISRVLYDLTCKPPATTEWEAAFKKKRIIN